MTPAEHLQKAQEAKQALDGPIGGSFDVVTEIYRDRLAAIAAAEPWAVDKIRSLALALKIAGEVRNHIAAVAAGGDVAQAAIDHAKKIEKLSPERRKILGL